MKVEISPKTIEWMTDPAWNPEYKGKTGEELQHMIEEDIEMMLRSYINDVEEGRDE